MPLFGSFSQEHPIAMPPEERQMCIVDTPKAHALPQAQSALIITGKLVAWSEGAIRVEGDKASIEQTVQSAEQEQTVMNV